MVMERTSSTKRKNYPSVAYLRAFLGEVALNPVTLTECIRIRIVLDIRVGGRRRPELAVLHQRGMPGDGTITVYVGME